MPVLPGATREEILQVVRTLGQPDYRAQQIAEWVYHKGARTYDQMTNLPLSLRRSLSDLLLLQRLDVVRAQRSADGTVKYLFALADGERVEAVFLPYDDRTAVCISTQVGCAAGCRFCATAQMGFSRNLTAGEMVDEVLSIQQLSGQRVSHVVYMGMGEPLWNLPDVVKSVLLLNREVGISQRHITVSTVGVVPGIYELAQHRLQITLAISLHAPNDDLRARIMPVGRKWKVQELIDAARYYTETTGRKVTFEYLLLRGVNDAPEHAHALAKLVKGLVCNVNLIPFNQVETPDGFTRPESSRVARFRKVLQEAGIAVTQRVEKGHDISAACGQLKLETARARA
ncbi:MAG: 23S rRNA (adenine(2503)-C(2))-methyltransferase RlmN [Armatimonadota bacterium]|nr:23S rRNA (adenine(2503)-C(2))-methyltransferase RlmN [bacterium]MDW8319983.1 23S rRNA (adenine(2503)-C(2))-methyltransferase RlmN [Armatimonadota bacterium]